MAEETAKSSEGKAFVKLSTRSPKDSKKALARAEASYHSRLAALDHEADDNERWIMLSEEVTKSSAIANGDEALELLLDSDRWGWLRLRVAAEESSLLLLLLLLPTVQFHRHPSSSSSPSPSPSP